MPIMLITAIIIKLTAPGPVLVEPENSHMKRIGKNGKMFRLYKFRSMPVNSDSALTRDPNFRKLYYELFLLIFLLFVYILNIF